MPTTIQSGDRGPDVSKWQAILGVPADGDFGPQTDAATRAWQSAHGITPDGVVGPQTWATALGAGATSPGSSTATTIARVRGIEKVSPANLRALVSAADWIGINPDWLATAISFETGGTFDPAVENRAGSGAVGLIQFIAPTANSLGTTTGALKRMTFKQQLEYVKKYFAPMRGKLHSLDDVYLYIFSPKGIGKPADFVMYTQGEKAYEQNIGFDRDGKGYITRGDVTGSIDSLLAQALAMGSRLAVPAAITLGTGILFALLIGGALYELGKVRS